MSLSQAKPKAALKVSAQTTLSYKDVKISDSLPGSDAGSKLKEWAAQQGVVVPQEIFQAMAPTQELQSKAIQKAVNHLRKVELRARGARQAIQTAEAQWKAFQAQLQDLYAKQLQAFCVETKTLKEKLHTANRKKRRPNRLWKQSCLASLHPARRR